ncbi:unnamed protein product [Prunus armeniaca]
MKSELQTIKKGYETIFQYLQRIKDARDHLFVAWVSFEDDDIVILALSGLPSEYNTFQCVVQGRENVLSLKDFLSQLLAEEATLEHTNSTTLFVSAMMAKDKTFTGKTLVLNEGSSNPGSHFRGRGKGRNHYPSSPRTHQAPPNSSPDILGPGIDIPTCQICNKKGHVAADCYQRHNQPSVPTSSDKITGSVLLKGLCTVDLYLIPFFTSPPNHKQASSFHKNHFFYLGHHVNTSLWHKRLEGKLAKLPFPYLAIKSIQPLEVVHSDVWSPFPTFSVKGFKYYSPLPVDLDFQLKNLRVVLPLLALNLHPMTTSSFNAASTVPEWQFAMREEIEALHAQEGSIAQHKARLVTKGFRQEEALTQEFDMKDLGQLLKDDRKPYSHPTQYRSIVGALQYLTFTRPDIAFSVNQACQFVHNPMESHVLAAYSDADWARDPNDQRFVPGFIVYLGSSPIS